MENINNYKALAFFDLDGTLLNSKSQLDEEVILALHQIRENGVLPFIATGRGHFELDNIMKLTGISGAVAMNGQYIILNGETIYKEEIPTDSVEKLLTAAEPHNEALSFYDSKGYWVSELTDFAKQAYSYTHMPLPLVDRKRYLQNEVNMLLVLTNQLSQVDYYKDAVPELNFFMNSPSSIDVTNISTNKGTGINHVKEILGFTGETFAFGDGRNDLHLLAASDHKTAMGNAVPELKELADFISTANTDHGIVNAFNHWGIL
ncbi:Cof-type HAD-IIB family hydrolase [Lactococcus allomyrinae]|uniref:Cof-type HAD-IIB family hydrolase n=1 Tax=Lactococcus allomyrinae TaxID=2419773 RepID=A0A387BH56_9LACT|nr:Cof-type HAD-IIB family hydrolase [Lactococcus allomyrinae]AYG00709.1 Cof-type HAD-IIB family hydrolase [Lactococcus allomyrinae]